MSKDIHISYDEFNKMPWFEILMILDEHSEFIEAQNGENENQNDMMETKEVGCLRSDVGSPKTEVRKKQGRDTTMSGDPKMWWKLNINL